MQSHRLNYLMTPALRHGPNTTFRLGSRWYNKVEVGDEVLIYHTGTPDEAGPIARGIITRKLIRLFITTPISDVLKCSCSYGNTIQGLITAMLQAYPNEFNLDSEVTVLEYELEGD